MSSLNRYLLRYRKCGDPTSGAAPDDQLLLNPCLIDKGYSIQFSLGGFQLEHPAQFKQPAERAACCIKERRKERQQKPQHQESTKRTVALTIWECSCWVGWDLHVTTSRSFRTFHSDKFLVQTFVLRNQKNTIKTVSLEHTVHVHICGTAVHARPTPQSFTFGMGGKQLLLCSPSPHFCPIGMKILSPDFGGMTSHHCYKVCKCAFASLHL